MNRMHANLSPGFLTWAEIDLNAIAANVKAAQTHLGPQTNVMAVVKANAYGHGALPVAKAALQAGATWLGVSRVPEGVALRQAGIQAPILLLGYCPPSEAKEVVTYHLTPALTTLETAHALAAQAQKSGHSVAVQIKIDSGMGRFGLLPQEVLPFAQTVSKLPGLSLQGVFTHMAIADEADPQFSRQQLAVYQQVLQRLTNAGIEVAVKHAANSAAGMRFAAAQLSLIRLGISLYGLPPSNDVAWPIPLQPAMSLKSRIARLQTLPPGHSVGYGRTFITSRPTAVALTGVGYGDGYPRHCSNRGFMLVGGQRAAVIGRVSMDQTSLDVNHIAGLRENDEVVVFGRQGDEIITATEVAEWVGTINYEIVTRIAERVPRLYLDAST